MADDPIIEPPRTAFDWWKLFWQCATAVTVVAFVAMMFYIQPAVEERLGDVVGHKSTAVSDDERLSELNKHLIEYRALSIKLVGTKGQERSDILDRRTLVVGRISVLIDLIPADKLPEAAQRFTLMR